MATKFFFVYHVIHNFRIVWDWRFLLLRLLKLQVWMSSQSLIKTMSSETILGISPLHRRRKYFCLHLPLHESSCICLQDTEKLMSSLFLSSSSCKILRIKRNQTDSTIFSGEVSEQFTINWDSYISSRRDVVVAKVSSMLSLDTVYNIVR